MTITRVWIEDGCIGCGLAKATQGIGGGLYEKIVFDEDGQLLTTTFMDYLIPSAMEIPDIEIHHLDQPSARNSLGVKGVGEGGAIRRTRRLRRSGGRRAPPLRRQMQCRAAEPSPYSCTNQQEKDRLICRVMS